MKQLSQQQQKIISENFQQGQLAIQRGLYDQAEKHFLAVLVINSTMIEATASLAFVYAASKQHAKAIVHLKALLEAMPNHTQTHHNLANSLYELQLYDEAIEHYQAALKISPNFVDSHIHCGIAYRMTKDYEAAITCLHRALDLDKANARAFYVLGSVYTELEDYNRALHCLECATGLVPRHAEYRVSFANVLEKASLDFEAGLEYHKACEIDPNYFYSFTSYGAYLLKNNRHDEALECFKRAQLLAPENLNVLDYIGTTYLEMGDTNAALTQFNAALRSEPKRITSLTGVEQVFQETGKLDAAIAICDEIISINTNSPSGYLLKARIQKSRFDDGLAEQLIRFVTEDDLNEESKIITNFALGKIFDDQSNFEQAFKYYANGNKLKNNDLNYSSQDEEARFSDLINFFDTAFFNAHQHLGVENNLPVVIVGMPRSGTTLTEQIIAGHPSVIGAGEVAFWGKAPVAMPLRLNTETPYPACLREITSEQAKDIARMYESTLLKIAGSITSPIHITDKMPHNFINVGLIALLFPSVKIIHTKRDPIDTCLSIYFQNFDKAHPYAFDLANIGIHYKQYERIMRHWHEVLPGRIMDISYEDTIADPEFWSRKLIDHIGLDWDDACLAPHKLERSVKTASHWQVRQPIYKTSVQRWKNYEQFLGPLIEALKD